MNKTTRSLPERRSCNLEEEIGQFLEHCRLGGHSPRTLDALGNGLRQMTRFLEGEGVSDTREVISDMLQRYSGIIVARVSRESAHLYLRTAHAFFRFLTDGNRLLVNPAESLVLPRLHRHSVGAVLSEAEIDWLISRPDVTTPTGLRDRAMLEFLYCTALRVSELRRMGVGEIDLGNGTAHVVAGKGARDRVLPIGNVAGTWLAKYLEESRPLLAGKREVDALFISCRGNPWSEQMAAIHIRRLGRDAGLRAPLTCHVIRRTVATRLLARGASPVEVSAILGHQDIRSLGRYVSFAARELKDVYRATHPREKEND